MKPALFEPIPDDPLYLIEFFSPQGFQKMDQRERYLAFPEIFSETLAEIFLVSHIVEDVVCHLKRYAGLHAETRESILLLFREGPEDCADSACSRYQDSGFSRND